MILRCLCARATDGTRAGPGWTRQGRRRSEPGRFRELRAPLTWNSLRYACSLLTCLSSWLRPVHRVCAQESPRGDGVCARARRIPGVPVSVRRPIQRERAKYVWPAIACAFTALGQEGHCPRWQLRMRAPHTLPVPVRDLDPNTHADRWSTLSYSIFVLTRLHRGISRVSKRLLVEASALLAPR